MADGPGDRRVRAARVVVLGLDGFPHGAITSDATPSLWRLGEEGGRAPDGGRSALPSTTYPGFASLLTGASPDVHRVRTTARREGAVPGWAGGTVVAVSTLVDACRAVGIPARAVLGDHLLAGVLRLGEAVAWPPEGHVPPGTPVDAHGYPTNAAVRPHALAAVRDLAARGAVSGLLFLHLNEADTLAHDLGPADPAVATCIRATDAIVAELVEALWDVWGRTVLIVVSDHELEARSPLPPVDPTADPRARVFVADWIGDGGAAWVRLRASDDADAAGHAVASDAVAAGAAALAAVDGVAAVRVLGDGRHLLLASPGRAFAGDGSAGGIHGGAGTARTVAIVAGGHQLVPAIASSIGRRPPRLADWAPTVAEILGVALPDADGHALLAEAGGAG